jgi:hypothetical protein
MFSRDRSSDNGNGRDAKDRDLEPVFIPGGDHVDALKQGVVTSTDGSPDALVEAFLGGMAHHRHWNRAAKDHVPA